MEKNKRMRAIVALLLAAVVVGCTKERTVGTVSPGSPIAFGASSCWMNGYSTRTEYSGEDESGSSVGRDSEYERIDWVVGKDRIRILCGQASGKTSSDYTLSGTLKTIQQRSLASVSPSDGGNGLQWGTSWPHRFFAMYPVAEMESNYDFYDYAAGKSDKKVLSSNAKIESTGTDKVRVTGVIPSHQNVVREGSEYKANMNYAYMYAGTSVKESESSSVALSFEPLVTTLEFTLKNTPEDPVNLNLTRLVLSSSSPSLTGTFTADLSFNSDEEVVSSIAPSGTTGDTITIDLPKESGATVPGVLLTSTPLKVTFLTLPQTQTGLTLTLYFGDASNNYKFKRTLELKDGGSFITVPACKKAYINNLGVPGTIWTLDQLQDVTLTYFGGYGSLSGDSGTFRSFKTVNGVSEPVSFSLEYSEDGTSWSTTQPSWMTMVSAVDFSGSVTGQDVKIAMYPLVNSNPDAHADALRAATAPVTDLSRYNPATNTVLASDKRTTANCYVVKAPGTYKFPLVYGNGLKNGSANDGAYHRQQSTATSEEYLEYFKDHMDTDIRGPWITGKYSKAKMTALVLWEDAPDLVQEVSISETEDYMVFTVPERFICQGNALLAVKVDDKIAWSWHIWVTDEDLSQVKAGSNSYMFAPVNIGWCEGATKKYVESSCYVRAVQSGSGKVTSPVTITQTGGEVFTKGNNPYYQWGRKDPGPAGDGTTNQVDKLYYFPLTGNTYSPQHGVEGQVTLGGAIQVPHLQFKHGIPGWEPGQSDDHDWCSSTYFNNWNSSVTCIGSDAWTIPVTKTIYDPSPVGFKVPPQAAYAEFTLDNFVWVAETASVVGGRVYSPSGVFFPALGHRVFNTGILGTVGSTTWYWCASVMNVDPGQSSNIRYAPDEVLPKNHSGRSHGFCIRPIKD